MRYTSLFLLFALPLWGQDLDVASVKPVGPPNLQSALWELATPSAAKLAHAKADPRVVVILVPAAGAAATIDTTSFSTLGVEILAQSKSLMRVLVPAASLRAVSELPSVAFVRRPHRPHAQQTLSEGLALIRALENHAIGAKGQGVKVAIIDGGFKGAKDLQEDMPESWWYRDYTGEGIYAGTDAHGTACAEIVYDVAPEAELYLYKVEDIVDLENAKDRCIENGVAIVNYSATWVNEGFGDGRGLICDIVNDAADNGILWVNAVGNYAQKHYAGFWRDSDADNRHNFAEGDDMVNFVDEIEVGKAIRVTLTWDDWPITTQDYDLYLYYQDQSGNIQEVDRSTDVQGDGGAPVEFIEYFAGRAGTYGISVVRVGEAQPKNFRVWSWHHDIEYPVPASSLGIPSDARGALSVGAIQYDQWDLGTLANYSSRGPTADGRIKPDLVAPSGVTTVSYGVDRLFGGTSAAAPHVAGAAALLKSANPALSRDGLWQALVEAAIDIGAPGKDDSTGYGKLVLPLPAPQIADVSPSPVQYDQILTIVGQGFGPAIGSSRVVFFAGKEPRNSDYLTWSDDQIQVLVPLGSRTGKVQVITDGGSDSAQVIVASPYIESIANLTRADSRAKTDDIVEIVGENFGAVQDISSVQIDTVVVSSFAAWSDRAVQFRVPLNVPSGALTIRTAEGTSNAFYIEIASPYLAQLSPPQVQAGDHLTLTGGSFGHERGTGYVLFDSDVRATDYPIWSNGTIVVQVPAEARSGAVQIFTADGMTGAAQVEIGSDWLEPLPSTRILGYSPPEVIEHPRSVKFGFTGIDRDVLLLYSTKEIGNGEVAIFINGRQYVELLANFSEGWENWYIILQVTRLHAGQNVIEFRNLTNQNRSSSFDSWQLADVRLWKPFNAKLVAGPQPQSELLNGLVSGLGAPFPTPFNAAVTIPFAVAAAGSVRLAVYNLMGQSIRVLADGWTEAGLHQVRWDGRTDAGAEAASGVYWAVLHIGDAVQTAKLALIR